MLAFYSISILHCVIKSTLLAANVRRGLPARQGFSTFDIVVDVRHRDRERASPDHQDFPHIQITNYLRGKVDIPRREEMYPLARSCEHR